MEDSEIVYPAGILVRTDIERYHPILFRYGARPSDDGTYCRYKSAGHLTDGFATHSEAERWIDDNPRLQYMEIDWKWDGIDIPAMTADFPVEIRKTLRHVKIVTKIDADKFEELSSGRPSQ